MRQVDSLCEHVHGDEPLQSLAKAIQELSRLRSPRAQVEQVAVRTSLPFAGCKMLAPATLHADVMSDANIATHAVGDTRWSFTESSLVPARSSAVTWPESPPRPSSGLLSGLFPSGAR